MGLKKSVLTKFGIYANEAYHRINGIRGENGGTIRYEVDTFFNQSVKDSGALPIESKTYDVPGDLHSKISVLAELYNILKLNENFSNSTDVFEQDDLVSSGELAQHTLCFNCTLLPQSSTAEQNSDVGGIDINGYFIHNGKLLYGDLVNVALSNVVWHHGLIAGANVINATIGNAVLKQILAI